MSLAAKVFKWFVPARGFSWGFVHTLDDLERTDEALLTDVRFRSVLAPLRRTPSPQGGGESTVDWVAALRSTMTDLVSPLISPFPEGRGESAQDRAGAQVSTLTALAGLDGQSLASHLKALWMLTSSAGDAPGVEGTWYAPLRKHTGLFKTFSRVEPSFGGILEFANKYGNLTDHAGLELWVGEIGAINLAVAVWDAWRARNTRTLGNHFRWLKGEDGKQFVLFDTHPRQPPEWRPEPPFERVTAVVASQDSPGGLWLGLSDKDPLRAAEFHLMQVIQQHASDHAAVELVWDAEQKRLTRVLMPRNLLGAIWLQLEHLVVGDGTLLGCPVCGTWFEVSRAAGRKDKIYCSDPCRTKAHREKQKERPQE